jgi:hypothetical protein
MTTVQNSGANFESVWAMMQETNRILDGTARRQKESDERFEKSREESEKEMKKSREEFDKKMEKSRKEFDEEMKKSREEFDKKMAESREESDRRMKKVEKTLGEWANNQGAFAEEYFFNSFEKGQRNFFGERFDEIEQNVKGIKKDAKDEYDILLVNGKTLGIIEVKYKAHENDIPKVLRKAETFRINFPEYKNHKVYLGLATLVFYPELEQECIKAGIAIIKQVGDTVVIYDKHLKSF